jgi:two-component system, NarL family, sensor histidine kinase UhpB
LEHCVETWRARLPVASLRLDIAGDFSALPESVTVTLYRLVQEALTNVAKHAAASRVNVRLERTGGRGAENDSILASVSDDGVGVSAGAPTRGLGLIGMRERVMTLRGTLVFNSLPGRGFELSARIPVPPEATS